MKKFILLISIATFVYSCKPEPQLRTESYQINVSAKGVYNGIRAYIINFDERKRRITIDTAMVVNEAFSFTGRVNTSSIRFLSVDGIQKTLPFIFEEGNLNI